MLPYLWQHAGDDAVWAIHEECELGESRVPRQGCAHAMACSCLTANEDL